MADSRRWKTFTVFGQRVTMRVDRFTEWDSRVRPEPRPCPTCKGGPTGLRNIFCTKCNGDGEVDKPREQYEAQRLRDFDLIARVR